MGVGVGKSGEGRTVSQSRACEVGPCSYPSSGDPAAQQLLPEPAGGTPHSLSDTRSPELAGTFPTAEPLCVWGLLA